MTGDALTGPAPSWRPGYEQDEPAYLATVRAMGLPGVDGPTGGDVVQGEIEDGNQPESDLTEHENTEGETND